MIRFKLWLRRRGLLCKKYVYKPPKKLRIQSTVDPGTVDFNEIYENLKKNQDKRKLNQTK
tara:strand:- start:2138 stop:2317 length:180 start_codon:yes stop_codon:yes gene_type:complete